MFGSVGTSIFADPKSHKTTKFVDELIKRFCGLISLCTIPRA